jgi:hypothetical protein
MINCNFSLTSARAARSYACDVREGSASRTVKERKACLGSAIYLESLVRAKQKRTIFLLTFPPFPETIVCVPPGQEANTRRKGPERVEKRFLFPTSGVKRLRSGPSQFGPCCGSQGEREVEGL